MNASMPTPRAPSIFQQRIILMALSAVIGAAVWWQNAAGSFAYSVQKFSPTPVPDIVAKLDFTSAEASWSNLTIDPQGNLRIDALTETALADAAALLHSQSSERASELAIARIALLLEKQFGATTSRQIIELLPLLGRYKEAEQHWWAENGDRKPPPHAELFELQDKLLGETLAGELFSEQRRTVATMLATYQIRNDSSLTPAEKDQALTELQKTLKEEGASSE